MSNQQNPQQQAGQRPAQQSGGQQHGSRQHESQQQRGQPAEQQNEGEGNRTAARAYNADQHRFAGDRSKVEQAAQSARKAVEGSEGANLAVAEKEGKKHARH